MKLTAEEIPKSFRNLLHKIAEEHNFQQYELDIHSLNSGGSNFMGDIFAADVINTGDVANIGNNTKNATDKTDLEIENKDNEVNKEANDEKILSLFAKLSNVPENARAGFPARLVYEREYLVYTQLAEVFHDLQEKCKVPLEERFHFAKYYGGTIDDVPEVIVLENLQKKGYVMADRKQSMSVEYARVAIRQLARYHALSFALEYKDPPLYDQLIRGIDSLHNRRKPNDPAGVAYAGRMHRTVLEAADPGHRTTVSAFFERAPEFWRRQHQPADRPAVLVHGDYRTSNIMVRYEEGSLTSLQPIDFQTIFHGSPINDLLYLIFTGTDSDFRRQHYDDCIQLYHDSLARALAALHVDIEEIYPHQLFLQHVRDKLLYGLGVATYVLPVVLVEEAAAPRLTDLVSASGQPADLGSQLYSQRVRGIIEDLVSWGALQLTP